MIGAIKFLSAATIVVAVSSMVLAGGNLNLSEAEKKAVKDFQELDLEKYDAERLKDFLDEHQPKGCIRGYFTPAITAEQTGQLLSVDKLWKQLTTEGSTLDCSFETMDKFGKIEIDNVKNKVLRYLLEEKFKFVLPIYLRKCVPVMHTKVEEFIEGKDGKQTEVFVNFLDSAFVSRNLWPREKFDLKFAKKKMNPYGLDFYWRKTFDERGEIVFQTDISMISLICTSIKEEIILKDIVDVVSGAVENKWTHLSKTKGADYLYSGVYDTYPMSLYLLGLMCQHERPVPSNGTVADIEVAQI